MYRKKGQSNLEYTLLITAVILAVVYGANMMIAKKAKLSMDDAGSALDKARTELKAAIGIEEKK